MLVKLMKKLLCLSLRKAGLVIGGLEVVESALMYFLLGSIVLNSHMFAEQLRDFLILQNEDKKEVIRVAVVVFGSIYLPETVINGVLSVLLVSSIRKTWLILNVIDIIVTVLTLAVVFMAFWFLVLLEVLKLVIGGLDIAGSVLTSVALGHLTLNLNNFADAVNEVWITDNEDIKEKRRVAVIVLVCIYLVETVINGVLSVLLVSGIRKKRHLMILSWLILNAIDIFINVLTLSFLLYVMSDDLKEFKFWSFLKVLKLALLCYIYFAIYSLYIQIKTNNDTEYSDAVYSVVAPVQ